MIKILFIIPIVCFFYTLTYSQDVKKKKQEEWFVCYYPGDTEAEFPGGEKAWKIFLDSNFAKLDIDSFYPNPKIDSTIRVFIEFIIGTAGNIVLKAPEEEKENKLLFIEIKRIFAKAPRWKPAITNGKKVLIYRTQPIIIILSHNED